MFGKMILPLLGSTPNVWNTCMVFFQGMLLLGYIYAHLSISLLRARFQLLLHICLLLLPIFVLPIQIPSSWTPPINENLALWQLMLMIVSLGLPFFLVSSSAPMLQKWFSNLSHSESKYPYFLYSASNLGSMLALLSYPVLLEPNFRLIEQSNMWSFCYWLLVVLIVICAFVLFRFNLKTDQNINYKQNENNSESLELKQKIHWVLLSFAPSSLLLGVTTYISTDIAAVPLLWVIPLSIYLLTFILVFARRKIISRDLMIKIMPFFVLPAMIFIVCGQTKSAWLGNFVHLFNFFVVAIVCHGELARTRPSSRRLTEFYLLISIGGFLGGLFNTLIAPVIFKTVMEYPLALAVACLLRPQLNSSLKNKKVLWLDFALPLALGILIVGINLSLQRFDLKSEWIDNFLRLGLPAIVCYSFVNRSIRFGLGVGMLLVTTLFYLGHDMKPLAIERSFFGVHRIMLSPSGKFHYLIHGKTIHGAQNILDKTQCEPLTYYYPTGPIGQVFDAFKESNRFSRVAAIGLGAGSLACYGMPNQDWTFYEIDPEVGKIARNEKYFTFLSNAKTNLQIVLGDGRLSLKKAPDKFYDLIVLDAFSSDAIPVHLITKEALKLYLDKLSNDGILAFHISNKYLNLQPVLGNLARAASLIALVQNDENISLPEKRKGKRISLWVLMARQKSDLGKLAYDPRWKLLSGDNSKLWTDDFSNIFSVLLWKQ